GDAFLQVAAWRDCGMRLLTGKFLMKNKTNISPQTSALQNAFISVSVLLIALSGARAQNPSEPSWTLTGTFGTARHDHTATLLPAGKVLVAGGHNDSAYVSSAELYDPATGRWRATGSMAVGRTYHTATLLLNGQVLVAGGYNGSHLSSAELYDPAAGTWTATGRLGKWRYDHAARRRPSGQGRVGG